MKEMYIVKDGTKKIMFTDKEGARGYVNTRKAKIKEEFEAKHKVAVDEYKEALTKLVAFELAKLSTYKGSSDAGKLITTIGTKLRILYSAAQQESQKFGEIKVESVTVHEHQGEALL